jgi:hypothetical protein
MSAALRAPVGWGESGSPAGMGRRYGAWAAGHPFVWLDDEITEADRRWVVAHHPVQALLHRVDPDVGLTAADFAKVRRWRDDCTGTS